MERMKGAKTTKDFLNEIASTGKDLIMDKVDEDEYGTRIETKDFQGRKLNILPVYYTTRVRDINDLSTDITSSMIAYADMANNFHEMSQVADCLEIARDVISELEIERRSGGRKTAERHTIDEQTLTLDSPIHGSESLMLKRYDDFLNAQVFGKFKKDAGSFNLPIYERHKKDGEGKNEKGETVKVKKGDIKRDEKGNPIRARGSWVKLFDLLGT